MDVLFYGTVFYLGCCFTSFFTLIGMRVPRGESIVSPPSHCDECRHPLGPAELFPIFSYLFQKGRCRHCRIRMSPFYAALEYLGGASFLLVLFCGTQDLYIGGTLFLLWSFGIVFTASDVHYFLLPNNIMCFFFLCTLLLQVSRGISFLISSIGNGAIVFILFFLLYLWHPEGIGGGDVKLFGIIGMLLGFQLSLETVFLSSLSGLLVMLLVHKMKNEGRSFSPLPFGPFIFLGAFLSVLLNSYFGNVQ